MNIESCICNNSCELSDENSDFEYDYINDDSSESRTYREKSPFGKYFSHIVYETCRNIILMDIASYSKNSDNKNNYYYSEIIDYLLTYYLPNIPLWSRIILGSGSDNKIMHLVTL